MTIDIEKAVIKIKLIPRSSRNEIMGFMDDGTLKIRLTAPPVDGQANQAFVKYLAGILKLNSENVTLISGKTRHNKLVAITGISQEALTDLLKMQIAKKNQPA
jgi:uncharacterized protein